jgi:tRNA A37 threonylcarbamoyladenosine synthetase subunit TsaC/SUA5/YrdC
MGDVDDVDDVDAPDAARPPIVAAGAAAAAEALAAGAVIAVPAVGGYCLAVCAGSPDVEEQLVELAADPEGPHYAVGSTEALRSLTSGWTDEVGRLLERCWPGPLEVFLPRADVPGTDGEDADGEAAADPAGAPSRAWAVVVGMPDGRALRRLCREQGPWRTVPLNFTEAEQVAQAFDAAAVALVVDGGRREGPPPTLVDATVSPVRVLREGALPASFIEGTMLMGTRRRFSLRRRGGKGGSA